MSYMTRAEALALRISTEFKTRFAKVGDNADLTTTVKSSLVAAINEVRDLAANGASVLADSTTSSTKTWSSTKITEYVGERADAIKQDLLGGVPQSAFDTLKEISDYLTNDQTVTGQILSALNARLSLGESQSFSEAQRAQGRANLDVPSNAQIGNPETDLVAVFNAGLQ